ncbi:(2Fe-2S) ferredoxin domain-containing protein [Methylobacterium terrae]|uniref:(2Fe-2S) ferredoxin domain-containing protein n=1 Tax=Methylobacterium terrae TaxID=2202827 RepID=UPI001ABF0088|nr:(2Fe-2S) ferredoxin domain-containing protein [Methylobacterium terrae]
MSKAPVTKRGPVKAAAAPFAEIVMVCAKCAKRQGVGAKAVRGGLKRALKADRRGRKVRVVETGCLGLCPKRSLTLATTGSLGAGRLVVIDPSLEPAAMLDALLPARTDRP